MSHVVAINCEITDLEALAEACKTLGLTLKRNQSSYKWYGRTVGDAPLPEGFKSKDLGSCVHAISVDGANGNPYEIGVCKRKDGGEGFTLLLDYWCGGFGLMEKCSSQGQSGKSPDLLVQEYAKQVTIKQLKKRGFRLKETRLPNGKIQLQAVK